MVKGWIHFINGAARPVYSTVRLNEVNNLNDGILRTLGILVIEDDRGFELRRVDAVQNYAPDQIGASF